MRDTAGIAAAPAARCRNRRRGSFVAFTLNGRPCSMAGSTGRRRVRPLFDTIGWVSILLLRRSLMLTGPSFVPLAALGESYTDYRCAQKGAGGRVWLATSIPWCGKPDAIGGHADMPPGLLIRRP